MRRQTLDYICASCRHCSKAAARFNGSQRRYVQISATPSSTQPAQSLDAGNGPEAQAADARFEVLNAPFSLLSASISASQNLYTRKGTLVGFNGKPEDAVSTLKLLEPFRRAALGIPFLYQRIQSTTPYTALIATKSPISSMVVVHLDGRLDWMVAQRNALLAWTGHTLSLQPRLSARMSLAHWGSTTVTGRGLLALTGKGQINQIMLRAGEEYVVHPSHVVAYAMMQHAPQPYRFKSSTLSLQIPNPLTWLPDTRFWRTMRSSTAWRSASQVVFTLRTWARRTIWGDRLFLHFAGPAQILLQSRGARLTDALTTSDVDEIADAPAGAVPLALAMQSPAEAGAGTGTGTGTPARALEKTSMSYASVRSGKVSFEQARGSSV